MSPPRRRTTPPSLRGSDARQRDGDTGATADLAARLAGRERQLHADAARHDLFLDIFRRVNVPFEVSAIAACAIEYLADWIPAPALAVVSVDAAEPPSLLADRGVTVAMRAEVVELARRVASGRDAVGWADLVADEKTHEVTGSAFALPLLSGERSVGAIIALDPFRSATPPRLQESAAAALRLLIEPIAVALEKSLRIERAEALSVTDDLTKLYNSRYLNLALRREVKRAARNQRPVSLLFVDLDGFKLINDTYGHLTGSRALVEVGTVIKESARETDVVARFGGDEFALILPDTHAAGARAVAERVCQRVAAYRLTVETGTLVGLTASVGIATLPDAAGSPDALMQAADLAMYRVKERGKNGIETAPALSDT